MPIPVQYIAPAMSLQTTAGLSLYRIEFRSVQMRLARSVSRLYHLAMTNLPDWEAVDGAVFNGHRWTIMVSQDVSDSAIDVTAQEAPPVLRPVGGDAAFSFQLAWDPDYDDVPVEVRVPESFRWVARLQFYADEANDNGWKELAAVDPAWTVMADGAPPRVVAGSVPDDGLEGLQLAFPSRVGALFPE